MKKLKTLEKFNEALHMGAIDGFDKLDDLQQHAVLLVLGMFKYNPHMDYDLEIAKDGTVKLTLGGKTTDMTSTKDPQSAVFLARLMEFVKPYAALKNVVTYTKGNRFVEIKKS